MRQVSTAKVTLREVAHHAQVHYATASTVLNGAKGSTRVSDETRLRVLDAADKLGYSANRAAQQLKTQRSHVVGLLTGGLENPFFARMVSVCSDALAARGYDVILASRRQDEVTDMHLLESLLSRRLAGVLLWSEAITEVRERVERGDITNVSVMGMMIPGCDCVAGELAIGVEEALDHLRDEGYQKIGYFAPHFALGRAADSRDRLYREKMAEWGRPERVIAYDGIASDAGAACAAAERLADELKAKPRSEWPDALLCFNDLHAFGAMMGLRRRGLRIPEDIALVGCDDLPLASQLDVPLTTIAYPLDAMCRIAVEMLLDRVAIQDIGEPLMSEPRSELLMTKLIVRASSIRGVSR